MGVAVLGLVVSLWLAQHQAASMAQIEEARFTQETRAFTEALSQRIAGHTEVVNGLRGLFTANPRLSRLDFERAASEMEVGQRYPGVRNLSFTRWVPGREREAYEARVRADTSLSPDGLPQFKIHPPGERAEYFVAEYLWPMFGNEGVLGLDISAQPANLAAMRYSRDSGQTVVSAPFDLLQETTHRAGIVIRVPVFDPTAGTAEQRFVGAVASTLRVYDLVQGLGSQGFLNGIAVAMADLGPVRPDSGDAMVRPLLEQTAPGLPGVRPLVRELGVHDRRWQLTFYPTRSFLTASETRLPWLAGLAAAVVSLLLASVVALLVRQRTLALVRAQLSDDARRESEERFRALFNQATVGVAQVDSATGQFVRVNQRYADILGYSPEEMVGMTFQSLTHPDDLAADLAQVRRLQSGDVPEYRLEKRYIHKDGHEVWGDLTVSSMWASGSAPGHHIAVVQDITARKRMEENLRANEQRLRSILERLPMGLCLVQDDGLISFRNQRYVQICGYTQEEVPDTDTWWQRAYPDAAERDAIRQRLLDTRHLGVIPLAEYTIRCADGKYKPVEISGIFVEGGRLITMQDLSERKAAEEEINQLAYYDPLTRLPNRRLLMDRLQQALATSARHQRSGALLMLDLDNFKTVNETRGHDRGDALLLQVAHRLRGCVHEDDTVARQGGDEFVVVLEDLGDSPEEAAARAEDVGQRILGVLREPYQIDGAAHHSSLSMGVTIYSGTRETVDELLKRADLALYQAKNAGRDTLRFYDPQMQAAVSARATLELDMRVGLAQGQFELYYQPQIDHGRITGAEALLRWRHPRDGFISPAHFIPLAEETGLILPLGEWVLQAACRRLAAWAQQPDLALLSLAVNVSPRQFHQSGFVAQVLAALAGAGADGHQLKLEMTEGLLLQDVEDTIDKMGQLKGYGVGFSLDDFGTGYSSLSYLKRLPLDQLKIDQSFVRDVLTDPNDAAIARTVVALGTSLGLRVIAEGVETEAQREFLERHHCHAWQGYLLSPPVAVAEFEALVRRTNGALDGRLG
ncbi:MULTISPECIES: EAL domain-containing protein [unclassified Acidovorax]|uniref:bifunctional diguanylate cyclase/phosphodiesterase n=1 Tax=unclassified Acidovorax TaxID=2684926 RepID=UPI0006F5F757|nr:MULTISPECIES: EAL domain-containing protein [unclassified Acidovorax]KRA14239.1 diguanylate cyclase [Acidovorax sp. Root568]MBD9406641.1 EAL domain-containing protein [Acidovorax sp. ACV02]